MSHFFLDVGISPKVLTLLIGLGHQGTHSVPIGLAKASDYEILDYAIVHDRILITSDLGFANLAILEQRPVPGLIILRLNNPSAEQMIASVKHVLTSRSIEEMRHSITVVVPHQIRCTKLPITYS